MGKHISEKTLIYSGRSIGILLLATLVSILVGSMGVGKENTLMVFMVGVLLVTAFTGGYQYGFVASILSVIVFNYFFTVPLHTFAITNTNDIVLIVFFLLASFISSSLTVRLQKQMRIRGKKEELATLLYEMSEGFLPVAGKENIIKLGIAYILKHTGLVGTITIAGKEEIYGTGTQVLAERMFAVPIIGTSGQIGTLNVYTADTELSEEQKLIIKAVANQTGIALDRELIYAEREKIKVQIEKEHMKSSMLRSISHDFRTPLTGIIGDCGYLLEAEEVDQKTVKQFAEEISEQALWLTKMMDNILNMTKLESGEFVIRTQTEVVDDVINEAVTHVIGLREKRNFTAHLPEQVIVADMDGRMMVQVLINLLDNAVKHTKEGDSISLTVTYKEERAIFCVQDFGDGIDLGMEEQIFREFVSLSEGNADKKRGIGLGLAICREVIKAHHGAIRAENRKEGGAEFTFWIPAKQVNTDGE